MADFWAGYISGVAGIIIGSPLDIIKTKLQSRHLPSNSSPITSTGTTAIYTGSLITNNPNTLAATLPPLSPTSTIQTWYEKPTSLLRGAAAPILGYGALNALLFYSYNQSLRVLGEEVGGGGGEGGRRMNLWNVWVAGAVGGVACWFVSTPTELIKCRAQVYNLPSMQVFRQLRRTHGIPRGLFIGGTVTCWRDSVGYGFYFWAYELSKRYFPIDGGNANAAVNTLLCGGVAGCVTWASVYPLDVVKTMVQVRSMGDVVGSTSTASEGLLGGGGGRSSSGVGRNGGGAGAWECTKMIYRAGGMGAFWDGIWVCLGRAFVVNAVVFFTYEWAMKAFSEVGGDEGGGL